MPRARLLQISDLHVGFLDAVGLPVAPAPFRFKKATGWLGHDPLALRAVARLVRRLRRDDVPLYVVTTGDLTARGHPDQFDLATGFIGATTRDGPSRVGLREAQWKDRAVAGNHDHWGGDLSGGTIWAFPHMWAPPTAAFRRLFSYLPFAHSLVRVGGLPTIHFMGVDTDADVDPWTWDRLLARGAFESHLRTLGGMLPAKQPDEIRVLLAHHCREHRGPSVSMVDRSRAALDAFIVRHEIDVLLSGHTHEARVAPAVIGGTREILYARCGTSSQVNPRDPRFRRATGWEALMGLPNNVVRSVVLHELDIANGRLIWNATAYALNRQNAFVPAPSRASSSPTASLQHTMAF